MLEARVQPGVWNLLAVDIWAHVLLEARVRPGAWNLLSVNISVDVCKLGCGQVLGQSKNEISVIRVFDTASYLAW